jgi:hypothetical protein
VMRFTRFSPPSWERKSPLPGSLYPLPWFHCASEVLRLNRLERLSAYVLPFRPFHTWGPRVFSFKPCPRIRSEGLASRALMCHLSVLPNFLPPPYRCALSTQPTLGKLLAEAAGPFSICRLARPFSRPLRSVENVGLTSSKSRTQGLATLTPVSAKQALESLFQLSTLLGLPLQSFAPPE